MAIPMEALCFHGSPHESFVVPWKSHGSPMEAPRKPHGSGTTIKVLMAVSMEWTSRGSTMEAPRNSLWKHHRRPYWQKCASMELPWKLP